VQHAVQRARELGDLVVGLDLGDALARVTGTLDLAGRRRQRRDRRHRPPCDHQPGQQREAGSAEHADDEEQPQPSDGRLDGPQRPRVLDVQRVQRQVADALGQRARLDPVAIDLHRPGARWAEVLRVAGAVELGALGRDDADDRAGPGREVVELGAQVAEEVAAGARVRLGVGVDDALGEHARRPVDLLLEVLVQADRRQAADGPSEAAQDHQRQQGGSAGEPPADRHLPRRGERSLRRGSYGGGAAHRRLRASF
jgi:hypothetical protein